MQNEFVICANVKSVSDVQVGIEIVDRQNKNNNKYECNYSDHT